MMDSKGLKSFEDVKKLATKYGGELPESLLSSFEQMRDRAKNTQFVGSKFQNELHDLEAAKKIKIIKAEVPTRILPNGCQAFLSDIKVSGHRGAPDDEVYKRNPELQKMIPRGFSVLNFKIPDSEEYFDVVLYATKKFTGGIGDEDEVQPENHDTWKEYSLKDPNSACKIVAMDKLNGEAAHFSCRFINGQFYIIVGSKNVHMLIRKQDDIDLYVGDRYNVAKNIAKALLDRLDQLEPERRDTVLSLLHHTKTTMMCEILQPTYQHIVNIGHLPKPKLCFVALTPTFSEEDETSLTAVPPHYSIDLMSKMGFCCADYKIVLPEDINGHTKEVRNTLRTEGEVLYFLDKDDKTIGMYKLKTYWYVLLRALREKMVYHIRINRSLEETKRSTNKRFSEIQQWLKFSDEYLHNWENLAFKFAEWIDDTRKAGTIISKDTIRPTFPNLWKQFLEEKHETDEFVSS